MSGSLFIRLFNPKYYKAVKAFRQDSCKGILKDAVEVFCSRTNAPSNPSFEYDEFLYGNKDILSDLAGLIQTGQNIVFKDRILYRIEACDLGVLKSDCDSIDEEGRSAIDNKLHEELIADIIRFWDVILRDLDVVFCSNKEQRKVDYAEINTRISLIQQNYELLRSYRHLCLYFGTQEIEFKQIKSTLGDEKEKFKCQWFIELLKYVFYLYPKSTTILFERNLCRELRLERFGSEVEEALRVSEIYIKFSHREEMIRTVCEGQIPDIEDFSEIGIGLKKRVAWYCEHAGIGEDSQEYTVSIVPNNKQWFLREIFDSLEAENAEVIKESLMDYNDFRLANTIAQCDTSFDAVYYTLLDHRSQIIDYNEIACGRRRILFKNYEQITLKDRELFDFFEKEQLVENLLSIKLKCPLGYQAIIKESTKMELLCLPIEKLKGYLSLEPSISALEDEKREYQRLLNECHSIQGAYSMGFQSFIDQLEIHNLEEEPAETLRIILGAKDQILLEDYTLRAKKLCEDCPAAVKEHFGEIPTLTAESAQDIVEREEILKARQHELSLDDRLEAAVQDWERVWGIPYYFYYWYYPKRFANVSVASSMARYLVYSFKDGRSCLQVIKMIKQKMSETFEADDLQHLSFVCIPASTIAANRIRYKGFSDMICNELGMEDAFEHIHIIKEKEPSHLGGTGQAEYGYDKDFFKGKRIIIFDDVVTTGGSLNAFNNKMVELGARVICAISIGRTYSDWNGHEPEVHPWTGEL